MKAEFLHYLLGGGFLSFLVGLLTLRAGVRMKTEEADRLHLENVRRGTEILMENIVTPLKAELAEMRRDLAANKCEMARLRRVISRANACPYRPDCPVLEQVRGAAADGQPPAGGGEEGGLPRQS